MLLHPGPILYTIKDAVFAAHDKLFPASQGVVDDGPEGHLATRQKSDDFAPPTILKSPDFVKDVEMLAAQAFDAALSVRSCKSSFVWDQMGAADSFDKSDVETIPEYNVEPRLATGLAVKVVYGPVYKIVDNQRVLLRGGEILSS
jgi:hypothetical protein